MSLYWTGLIILAVIGFAIGETYALRHNKLTLSRYVWSACKAWPLLPFLMGMLVGGVAVHLLWHWCPELGSVNG